MTMLIKKLVPKTIWRFAKALCKPCYTEYYGFFRALSLIPLHIRYRSNDANGVVLYMHGIEGGTDGTLSINTFSNLIQCIQHSTKTIISILDWQDRNNFVILTFDDVPESFYLNAYPILKKLKIPFTIFVTTSLLDKPGFITTKQLIELSKDDLCTVGSHMVHHDFFRGKSYDEAKYELEESKKVLENIIDEPVTVFSFPFGNPYAIGRKHIRLVTDYYKYGFSTYPFPLSPKNKVKLYELPRIPVLTSNIKDVQALIKQ